MISALVTGCVLAAFATWGFLAPALDLRRSGDLHVKSLLVAYRRDISLIPRAVVVATKGAFRHPWTWSGPLFGWVILVVLVLVSVPFGVLEVLAGDEQTLALVMTPIALYVGLGSGIGLVRDTFSLGDSDRS